MVEGVFLAVRTVDSRVAQNDGRFIGDGKLVLFGGRERAGDDIAVDKRPVAGHGREVDCRRPRDCGGRSRQNCKKEIAYGLASVPQKTAN